MIGKIKIRNVLHVYNGAMVVGGKQRGKARATEENGPTAYALDPKLSKRRTRENERESRLY